MLAERCYNKFSKFLSSKQKPSRFCTYKKYQHNLLLTEIKLKKSCFRMSKNEVDILYNQLQSVLNCIDFAHVYTLFLSSNDTILKAHYSVQQKKLNVLFKNHQP